MREHLITREELETAIREVNLRATELHTIQATLNAGDPVAVKRFQDDTNAYNQRNSQVRELLARYQAQQAHSRMNLARLMGSWEFSYAVSKGFTKKAEISGTATYHSHQSVQVDARVLGGKREYHPSWKGHWESEGDTFRIIVDSVNKDCAESPGDSVEYRILEVTDTEFRYRDLKEGTELVKCRARLE